MSSVSGRTKVFLAMVLAVIAVTVVGQIVRFTVMIERPGPVQNVLGALDEQPILTITGAKTYPTSGTLDFTTVSIQGGPGETVSLWPYLAAKLDREAKIVPLPEADTTTKEQARRESVQQMVSSQEAAEVVAIRATGGKVGETVSIVSVVDSAPAHGRLQERDQLLRIGGRPANTAGQVRAVMSTVKPGTTVTVTVRRGGAERAVQVPTVAAGARAVMGIQMRQNFTYPFRVKVNSGKVGGPSAGLMFSLAIYDKLTPGPLTGGREIAGTGTMSPEGQVGPIGGIQMKLIGARDAGADFFLAPTANCDEVRGHVPSGMQVVKVSNFTDAQKAVRAISAGNSKALPAC